MLKQDQGGVEEELLFSRRSFRDVLAEEAGGGDADQGAEEEVPHRLTITPATPYLYKTCLHKVLNTKFGFCRVLIIRVLWSNWVAFMVLMAGRIAKKYSV